MSIKTTHLITREVAIQAILHKVMVASDSTLANMLEEFEESYFRNYRITDQNEIDENDKLEWPMPTIRTLKDF